MLRRSVFLIALALGALRPIGADATTVESRTLRQLTAEATAVVHGTVVASSTHWTDNRSLIVTDYRVQVLDALKGDAVGEIVVTQPGGRVGAVRVDADGATAFRVGDETVLFLGTSARGVTHILGLSQGRFDVVTDARGNKSVRGLSEETAGALRRTTAPAGAGVVTTGGDALPLDAFLGGIRELVRDTIKDGGR
jgi:hypothetical protein